MTKLGNEELIDLILAGKSKSLEFCDENIDDETLARHLVAFSNAEGGNLVFGIDDDSQVLGLMNRDVQYRISDITANMIFPVISPNYYEITLTGKIVGVVEIPEGREKPYYYSFKGRHNYMIRAGKTSRKITPNQLQSFLDKEQKLRYELSPVKNATFDDLDQERLKSFLQVSRGLDVAAYSQKDLISLLVNMDILSPAKGGIPTVAGLLLFGKNPGQFLAQSKISIVLFSGNERNQESIQMEVNHPLISVRNTENREIERKGAIEEIISMIADQLFDIHEKQFDRLLPKDALVELILNAIIHRNYADSENKISIEIFADHLEITTPGNLCQEITLDKILVGQKATRNPLLYHYLAENGYFNKNDLPLFDLLTHRHKNASIKQFEFDPHEKNVRTYLKYI